MENLAKARVYANDKGRSELSMLVVGRVHRVAHTLVSHLSLVSMMRGYRVAHERDREEALKAIDDPVGVTEGHSSGTSRVGCSVCGGGVNGMQERGRSGGEMERGWDKSLVLVRAAWVFVDGWTVEVLARRN